MATVGFHPFAKGYTLPENTGSVRPSNPWLSSAFLCPLPQAHKSRRTTEIMWISTMTHKT